MTNILFVSCYSVDINNSASIELIYYMNLLASTGEFNVHLLTMDFPKDSIYYDKNICNLVDNKIVVHRVSGGKILDRILPKVPKGNSNATKKNKLLIKMKNAIVIVDPYTSWINKAVKYFENNLKDSNFDIILGMHEPPSSLICSYKIKKFVKHNFKKNVKLISYFSDPYCDEVGRKNKSFFSRFINLNFEKLIVKNSDRFLFVTEKNFEYYANKYGIDHNKVELIHRGFNEKLYSDSKKIYPDDYVNGKINFLHAGDIVKGVRETKFFVEAMDILSKEHSGKFKRITLNFFGNINDDEQLNLMKRNDYINFKSRVSYMKVVSLIVNAEVLIIFGNKQFKQIPAKIYDYMGSCGYILVILESFEDPMYDLVKNLDGVLCCLNNRDDILKNVLRIIDNFDMNRKFIRDEFNGDVILKKLNKIFQS